MMDEIALEVFLQNGAFDKPVAVKNGNDEICKAINDEDLLISLIVPNMEALSVEQGESLESMQIKAQKIAQNMKLDF